MNLRAAMGVEGGAFTVVGEFVDPEATKNCCVTITEIIAFGMCDYFFANTLRTIQILQDTL